MPRVKRANPDRVHFWCPGCDQVHGITSAWKWNGDLDYPTFSPSILVRGGPQNGRCHSFVGNGRIEFLNDCTHNLSGQTVDLPEWPYS